MIFRKSLILLLALSLGACAFKKDDEKPVGADELYKKLRIEEEQELLARKMTLEDFTFEVVPLKEANRYELQVSWKQEGILVEVNEITSMNAATSSLVSPIKRELTNPGQTHRISIKAIVRNTVIFESNTKIDSPKDFVIGNSFTLSEDFEENHARIFVAKGVVITTMGHDFSLTASEIVFEGATIQSFPSDSKPSVEQDGGDAGSIEIKAKSVKGLLTIKNDGEEGGDGKSSIKPNNPHPGCAGTKAGNGGNGGEILIFSDNSDEFKLSYSISPGPPGRVGVRGSIPWVPGVITPPDVRDTPCDKYERDARQSDSKYGRVGKGCHAKFDGTGFKCGF